MTKNSQLPEGFPNVPMPKCKPPKQEGFDGDSIPLPSGKILYANNQILGIDDTYELSEGFDGVIDKTEFTAEDIVCIADLAIGRWTVVKNEALQQITRTC